MGEAKNKVLIQPLVWKLLYAVGVAKKRKKKKKKKKESSVKIETISVGDPVVVHQVKNLTSIQKDTSSIPGLHQWIKDPELLWLCCRPAAAALI